ncbi:MAG: hypothetical protein IIA78_04270 [Proteobacteria bacterium]|nr:hypothetical protein [Pseudomonadota bacterium]
MVVSIAPKEIRRIVLCDPCRTIVPKYDPGLCEFRVFLPMNSITQLHLFIGHYYCRSFATYLTKHFDCADVMEDDMRISILLIALTGILAFSPADAKPDKGQRAENVAACNTLKGGTPGLHGLCLAFCAKRDLSKVDLNDIASVKRAAPKMSVLHAYDSRRQDGDPVMPCFKNQDDGGGDSGGGDSGGSDTGGGDSGGSDTGGGTEPPAAAACPCWTGEELASIDGVLPDAGFPVVLECVSLVDENINYRDGASEGYDYGFTISPETTAWASVDTAGPDPYSGCGFLSADANATLLVPLENADAINCMAEIDTHCTLMGQ